MSWHSLIAALLFGFLGGVDASSGIVRGVNIGGWLVTEPWCVDFQPATATLLTVQDDALALQLY